MSNPSEIVITPAASQPAGVSVASYTVSVGPLAVAPAPQTYPFSFNDTAITVAADGTVHIPLVDVLTTMKAGDYAVIATDTSTDNVTSDPVGPVKFTVTAVQPNPPSGLAVI